MNTKGNYHERLRVNKRKRAEQAVTDYYLAILDSDIDRAESILKRIKRCYPTHYNTIKNPKG